MANRETKLMRIEHQWKYRTINDAEKEAEAIRAFTARITKKNNWACKALIATSEHNLDYCIPVIEKNGRKGRPIKKFLPKLRNKSFRVQPHLHILAFANPAQTLTSQIVENINKRHRRRYADCRKHTISRKKPVYGEPSYYIGYVMNQMTSYRAVDIDNNGILSDFDFKNEYEKAKQERF